MRGTPKRIPVNKNRSVRKFQHDSKRTKRPNVAPPPMRGGYRL